MKDFRMNIDQQKAAVAAAAVSYVMQEIPANQILGIGTGSTVNCFIDALSPFASHFAGVVSSSEASSVRLLEKGFKILDANTVVRLATYVDGADEINPQGQMTKGGGGALTREKIVASMSPRFICICDESKQVAVLGQYPLPVEVIPLAAQQVKRTLENVGAVVHLRQSKLKPNEIFVTDNHGWILDVSGLAFDDPYAWEMKINNIPGVICNGLFASQPATTLIVSSQATVQTKHF
jgi:ribose 5-phosphate isomerase A